jgi:ribonuclease Z
MKSYKKKISIFVVAILVLALLGGFLIISNPPIWLINAVAVNKMKQSKLILGDGLHALLTGTGTSLIDINRAGSSVAVQAGNKLFIVDAGDGSARNLQRAGLNIGKVDAVFLTHFHSDHIGGLGETMMQRWQAGSHSDQLPVYGPVGTNTVVAGFKMVYEQDKGYRSALHGEHTFPPSGAGGKAIEFDLGSDPMASEIIFENDGVKVTAFNVDHAPVYPAVGYRFEYKDRSLVISGDTVYTENLVEQSKGVDLLICDAMNQEFVKIINRNASLLDGSAIVKITEDISKYHITPEQAAKVAAKAEVKYLALTHILPPLPSYRLLQNAFLGDARDFFKGKIDIGRDGMLISLPAGSESINTKYLFD